MYQYLYTLACSSSLALRTLSWWFSTRSVCVCVHQVTRQSAQRLSENAMSAQTIEGCQMRRRGRMRRSRRRRTAENAEEEEEEEDEEEDWEEEEEEEVDHVIECTQHTGCQQGAYPEAV